MSVVKLIWRDDGMPIFEDRWKYDPEYLSYVSDLINNEKFRQLDKIVHHHHTTRFKHSVYVSYVSYRIARRMGLDARATARAGLLHDFFLESREEIQLMQEGSHNDVHPKLALKNALTLTELSDKEKDIILKHMFLCSKSNFPRYRESYIVTSVDKYCAMDEVSRPLRSRVIAKYHSLKGALSTQA